MDDNLTLEAINERNKKQAFSNSFQNFKVGIGRVGLKSRFRFKRKVGLRVPSHHFIVPL